MDKSIDYVEMCQAAVQLQSRWSHSNRSTGDFYYHKKLGSVYGASMEDQDDDMCVWIPRIDQLMEIMKINGWEVKYKLLEAFTNHVAANSIKDWTWEMLWLTFFMRREYNLKWNSENNTWIEIN